LLISKALHFHFRHFITLNKNVRLTIKKRKDGKIYDYVETEECTVETWKQLPSSEFVKCISVFVLFCDCRTAQPLTVITGQAVVEGNVLLLIHGELADEQVALLPAEEERIYLSDDLFIAVFLVFQRYLYRLLILRRILLPPALG
jgi:hypothetical protein